MLNLITKNIAPLYIIIFFLAVFSNSCNIYGQGNLTLTDKEQIKNLTESNKALQLMLNNLSKPTITQNINSNPNNNTGAISSPVGNITALFGNIGPWIPIYFLTIVSITMMIPLVIDMILGI